MCRLSDDEVSDKLKDADDCKDDDHSEPDHVAVTHLITIANGKVTQTPGADGPGNGCNAHKTDEGDHGDACDARDTFLEVNAEDDLCWRESH